MGHAVVDCVQPDLDLGRDGNEAAPCDEIAAAARTLAEAARRLAEAGGQAGAKHGRLAEVLARLAGGDQPDCGAILAASPRFAATASSGAETIVEAIAGCPEGEAERVRLAMLLLRACVWFLPGDPAAARTPDGLRPGPLSDAASRPAARGYPASVTANSAPAPAPGRGAGPRDRGCGTPRPR